MEYTTHATKHPSSYSSVSQKLEVHGTKPVLTARMLPAAIDKQLLPVQCTGVTLHSQWCPSVHSFPNNRKQPLLLTKPHPPTTRPPAYSTIPYLSFPVILTQSTATAIAASAAAVQIPLTMLDVTRGGDDCSPASSDSTARTVAAALPCTCTPAARDSVLPCRRAHQTPENTGITAARAAAAFIVLATQLSKQQWLMHHQVNSSRACLFVQQVVPSIPRSAVSRAAPAP